MTESSRLLVVGGTSGLGLEIATSHAARGASVIITGRDAARAQEVAAGIDGDVRGLGLELAEPATIGDALADIDGLDHVVISAIDRDANTVRDYRLDGATYLITMKLIGYTEVVHTLLPRLSAEASIVLFGGLALHRPYPGSTTVSTVNGGVVGLMHALAAEVAPVRVNVLHPGIVGDSPFWSGKAEALANVLARTPTRRHVAMEDIVDGVDFLLRNRSVNGIELAIDGGWLVL